MKHIMVDVESLGVQRGCVVLSIGAVEFDETEIIKTFYIDIDPVDAQKQGLTIEAGTVQWWFTQNQEARTRVSNGGVKLVEAMIALTNTFDWHGRKVWANAASFDLPILDRAYEAVGLVTPWKYYDEMCYRTLKNLVPKATYNKLAVKPAVAHDALEDAKAQALTLQKLLATLTIA